MKPRFNGFARVIKMSLSTLAAVVVLASARRCGLAGDQSAHPSGGVLVIDGHGFRKDVDVSVNDVDLKVLSVTRDAKSARRCHRSRPARIVSPFASGETKSRGSSSRLAEGSESQGPQDRGTRGTDGACWDRAGPMGSTRASRVRRDPGLQGPKGDKGDQGRSGPAGPAAAA